MRNASLRLKMGLGVAALLAGVAVFLLAYVPSQLRRHSLGLTTEKAEAIGEIAAHGLVPGLVFDDSAAIAGVIEGLRLDRDVAYVVVQDTTGRVRGSFNLPLALAVGYGETDEREPELGDNTVKVSETARLGEQPVGVVRIGLSLDGMLAGVQRTRSAVAVGIGLALVLANLGIFLMGSVLVGNPLARIVRAAEGIARGDLSRRAGLRSGDEIGRLAMAFDAMVERLVSVQAELQTVNQELESRVTKRTQDLEQAYESNLRSQQAIVESERRFRTMFDSAAVGIALIGTDLRIKEVNPAFARLWRGDQKALEGRTVSELCSPEAGPEVDGFLGVLAGTQETAYGTVRCLPIEGEGEIWGRGAISSVRDPQGHVQFGIAMVEDITKQKHLEDQLRQSQKLEAIGHLAGGVAHDFNNLLTTINGVSELILADLPAGQESLRNDLKEIRNAGERAAGLTRQLLAFGRQQALRPRVIDLNVTIREMSSLLRRLIGENIQLDLALHPLLPSVTADPGQVGQVIMNLAVNARDAMPNGGRLRMETTDVQLSDQEASRLGIPAGHTVRIAVTDTGHGMDEATRRRIFEPFFTTKAPGKGTGLGLATVYGILIQSGGAIAVESEVNAGTSFLVYLPVSAAMPEPPSGRVDHPVAGGSGTILLVEDEEFVRLLTARMLRRAGYTVVDFASPEAALAATPARIQGLTAVVTDVVMPGMSGPEMVSRLHALRPDLPVLYLSGYARGEIERATSGSSEAAPHAVLTKPMTSATLANALEKLLAQVTATAWSGSRESVVDEALALK